MNTPAGLDRCLAFINCQISPPKSPTVGYRNGESRRAVTLSRQAGSGAHAIAEKLAEFLQANAPNPACPWTVFDRNLVEKVLEDHKLPAHLAKFMPEDRISEIADTMDELFGLHPSSWTLVHKTAETILQLAELGNVILIGRGANVITSNLDYVFHVRLVAPLEKRIRHVQELRQVSAREAAALIEKEDLGRRRFLKKYFNKDIDDPLLYHLTINTGLFSYEDAARLIGQAVLQRRATPALTAS
jgi:cytidylate kinase